MKSTRIYSAHILSHSVNTVPGPVTELTVSRVPSKPDSLSVSWDAPTTPCTADDYIIEYQLNNLERCNDTDGQRTAFTTTTDTLVTITGLEAYSTYRVFVSARNDNVTTENSDTGTTAEEGIYF